MLTTRHLVNKKKTKKKLNYCYKNVKCGKIMIYDNKLKKKLKTFLQNLSTRWGFFQKKLLSVVEFSNKKSSGPENIRGGGGGGGGWLLTLVNMIPALDSVFLKLFLPGRYPIQLA